MSLLATASEWKNENAPSKKRTPTLGGLKKVREKTLAKSDETADSNNTELGHYSIEDTIEYNNHRNERVTELLTNLTHTAAENDGDKLANFNPLPRTASMARSAGIHPSATDAVTSKPPSYEGFYTPSNPLQQPVPTVNRNYSGLAQLPNVGYLPGTNAGSTKYTQYNQPSSPNKPYYAKGNVDDRLMEKINYMIHLLEEQQLEKTNNVMEEFLLYSLLGVFMIYTMDSFARAGKYVR